MTPLKAQWFTGARGTIGLVQVQTEHGEIVYKLGFADGFHEQIDVNNISNLGASFPKNIGDIMFKVEAKDDTPKPTTRRTKRNAITG